ncbi:hypothetical protein [Chitinophaga polysaccharea]|uniref:hypothetical protein n=1 Tax=Chitinophaga polysaccharea TaxID=1293035 RepID=UPI00115A1DD5|nr:hypothetical protein [Chitinophaga polysaccharea]
MRIIFPAILFGLFFLSTSHRLYAQHNDGKKVKEELIRILDRNVRCPIALAEKKISAVFSLRINLSGSNRITSIDASKFSPKELIPQLTNPDIYKEINWQAIFEKKQKEDTHS